MLTWSRSSYLVLFTIAVLAAGCSATGPLYRPIEIVPPQEALVYVYRMPSVAFSGQSVSIRLDGETVAKLLNDGYTALSISPGEHTLTLYVGFFLQRIHLKVRIEAGQTYFFAMRARTIIVANEWWFGQVNKQQAETEISDRHYQAPLKYAVPEPQGSGRT